MTSSEHLSTPQVERYRGRSMSSSELLALDEHVARCEACRRRLWDAEFLDDAVASLREELRKEAEGKSHLSYEQLAGYVDESLDSVDLEIVEAHLEMCAPCREEARDLRAFRKTLSTSPADAPVLTPGLSLRDKWVAFWSLPARWVPLQVGLTAVVAVVAIWLTSATLRTEIRKLQAQTAELQQERDRIQLEHRAATTRVTDLEKQLAETQKAAQPSSTIVVALNDPAGPILLASDGSLQSPLPFPARYAPAVKSALTTGRVETSPALAGLIGKRGTLLGRVPIGTALTVRPELSRAAAGEGASFTLLSPVGTAVETDRPSFRWQSLEGATHYKVIVHDEDFTSVATSPLLTGTEWTAPDALDRDKAYSWQVIATLEGTTVISPQPPAPEARFKVIEARIARGLERARESHGSSPLLMGVIYAQAGLLDQAEQEFQMLAAANPQSEVAQELLSSVKAIRQR